MTYDPIHWRGGPHFSCQCKFHIAHSTLHKHSVTTHFYTTYRRSSMTFQASWFLLFFFFLELVKKKKKKNKPLTCTTGFSKSSSLWPLIWGNHGVGGITKISIKVTWPVANFNSHVQILFCFFLPMHKASLLICSNFSIFNTSWITLDGS